MNVTVEAVGCHFINVTWSPPPEDDWNGEALKYNVQYKVWGCFKCAKLLNIVYVKLSENKCDFHFTIFSVNFRMIAANLFKLTQQTAG